MTTSVADRAGIAVADRTAVQQAFGIWSRVYDDALNPLLSLEQRFLARMLPDVRGLDVLDAGCGTGRWLAHLAAQSPKTLVGIDASPEMLARASAKSVPNADLRLGDCTALPLREASTDLALASFVLSYIHDLEKFAEELARTTRAGANVFLTDMHPETALSLNWKRSFQANGAAVEIEARLLPLERIVSVFHAFGFAMLALFEPGFGVSERTIFEQGKKIEVWSASACLPAIYLLQLQKTEKYKPLRNPPSSNFTRAQLTGARCALGANESVHASVAVERGRIRRICSHPFRQPLSASSENDIDHDIDLSGYLVLPGLINAHDHLEFGLFPNLGHGPYKNSTAWAADIHRTEVRTIELHRGIPKDVRLWWGAIRNLLCGATTVFHHNPPLPERLSGSFPVRVPTRFGWAHSLALDAEVVGKFQATRRDMPFVLHAAEGTDRQSANEIFDLERMGVLDERTVLVHGLALSTEGVSLLNRRGGTLIVCPTSNRFLFGCVHTRELLNSVANLALGSDSPLTAAGDLLDEIRFAHSEIGLAPEDIYDMATARSAKVLHLQEGEGRLQPGAVADLIAVRDGGFSPAETVMGLSSEDIELVMLAGQVQLASPSIYKRLPDGLRSGLQPLDIEGQARHERHIRWIRAPLIRLFAETERVLGSDIRVGGKRVRHAGTT